MTNLVKKEGLGPLEPLPWTVLVLHCFVVPNHLQQNFRKFVLFYSKLWAKKLQEFFLILEYKEDEDVFFLILLYKLIQCFFLLTF